MRRIPRAALLSTILASAIVASPFPAPAQEARPAAPRSDENPLRDPTRPVSEIGPDYVVLQWYTPEPCETRAQVRASELPMTAWRPERLEGKVADPWRAPGVRVVEGPPGKRAWHVLRVTGLKPGTRYFYRLHDPQTRPTAREAQWGAEAPWRREYAVSTQGGRGRKTVVRVPVKVLLMPNVVNIASAHLPDGKTVPPPPRMTEAELSRIREEYAVASRFFWVNSGMRYWVDFRLFVDDRWQRWGDAPANVDAAYRGWPVSRSYAGKDFDPPGGGTWTILDTRDPLRVNAMPVAEEKPYAGQMEQAFPRRWNAQTGAWEWYASGGGTFGVDGWPRGVPGRSQYLGGSDTAWLVAHEFHHQMESQGAFSLSNREDDRIVFDHPAPRKKPDAAWATSGRHGEHWDVLAFWDRTLTDAQWLRVYFGETVSVADRDEDGFPDDDARLPLDEKRFGSDGRKGRSDGRLGDLEKAMLSTWAPAPLQFTFVKPAAPQHVAPKPRDPDSDGDGLPDDADPYPLYPFAPLIYPLTARVDGDGAEWANVPPAGRRETKGLTFTFRQAHDDDAYYGSLALSAPWKRVAVSLDGEGKGLFSGEGVQGFVLTDGPDAPTVRQAWGGAPGLKWELGRHENGETVLEFSLPNRGEGLWFWDGGGREIGVSIEVTDLNGGVHSLYEPYRLFYARMLGRAGRPALPPGAPAELTREAATRVLLTPGSDPALKLRGEGWTRGGDVLRHAGDNEGVAYLDGLNATAFDLWVRFEAKQDAILAAFTPETPVEAMGAGRDYVAFVGGYANTVTRLRLFGRETGDDDTALTPGEHTMQLTRRNGEVWCLLDGRPVLYARDPDPKRLIDRLGVLGGYNGAQAIKEVRARY